MTNTSEQYLAQQKTRVKYGFIWVIISALLWGASYVGFAQQNVVSATIESTLGTDMTGLIAGTAVISAVTSMMYAIVTFFVWCVPAGKAKEVVKTLAKPKIDMWLAFATCFGGIMAVFGTFLATAGLGAGLAATASIISIAVGAIVASVWNKEKMARNTVIGIVAIIIGGFIMLDPSTIINSEVTEDATVGYIGLILCIIGFGLEGNITVRVYDVTDTDSSLAVKQIWDTLIWFIILLPVIACYVGFGPLYEYLANVLTNPDMMLWLLVIALVMVVCNASTVKAFPLIGVARVASLNALYAPFSMIFLLAFMGVVPSWVVIIGVIIALFGVYIMYHDSGDLAEGNRNTGGA